MTPADKRSPATMRGIVCGVVTLPEHRHVLLAAIDELAEHYVAMQTLSNELGYEDLWHTPAELVSYVIAQIHNQARLNERSTATIAELRKAVAAIVDPATELSKLRAENG